MHERVKIFTYITGHGETLVDPPHEERINQWIAGIQGEIVEITQSESPQTGSGHHVSICIWYVPAKENGVPT